MKLLRIRSLLPRSERVTSRVLIVEEYSFERDDQTVFHKRGVQFIASLFCGFQLFVGESLLCMNRSVRKQLIEVIQPLE